MNLLWIINVNTIREVCLIMFSCWKRCESKLAWKVLGRRTGKTFLLWVSFTNFMQRVLKERNSYVCHGIVRHSNYLPSSELELLVGCDDDEENTALKCNWGSYPVTPPSGIPYALCLQHWHLCYSAYCKTVICIYTYKACCVFLSVPRANLCWDVTPRIENVKPVLSHLVYPFFYEALKPSYDDQPLHLVNKMLLLNSRTRFDGITITFVVDSF